jgi:hypothetical protein
VAAPVDERPARLERARRDDAEVDGLAAEPEPALGDARDVEQVVDQPHELADLAVDDVAAPRDDRGVLGLRAHELDDVADRGQRVAQLVREHRQEVVLAAVGVAQRLLEPHGLGDVGQRAADDARVALAVALDAAPRAQPARRAVGRHAELHDVVVAALDHRLQPRQHDRPVLLVDRGQQRLERQAAGDRGGVGAEEGGQALVARDAVVGDLPVPGRHRAGGQRQAQALLAGAHALGRRLELGRALDHAPLELRVEQLELPRLAVELGKGRDLGAQQLGHDRHRDVVHRAALVAADAVDVAHEDRGDEDDRRRVEARVLPDHVDQVEAVELRHADVDEDDGDVVLEEQVERLARRAGLDQVLAELAEDGLVAEQLGRLVVDHQHVDLGPFAHATSGASTSATRTGAARC